MKALLASLMIVMAAAFAGCSGGEEAPADDAAPEETAPAEDGGEA